MKEFYVEISEDVTEDVVWRSGPFCERYADKLACGRNRNLDQEKYTVSVVRNSEQLECF